LSPAFNYTYESIFYEARVSFDEGRQIKEAENHNGEFKKIFLEKMRTSKCFATNDSKMENKPFVGFTSSIDINDGCSRKFRIAKILSTFTVKALAIGVWEPSTVNLALANHSLETISC
jgi:hypothetical protein